MTTGLPHRRRGFTLIELMIVVAIIGILAGIAIPKFSQLITKGYEANTKGNLGALRSAIAIYYSDMQGWFPADDLTSLTTNAKYLAKIPIAKYPQSRNLNIGHPDIATVLPGTGTSDGGGWAYDNTSTDSNFGRLIAACTHKDVKGLLWTSY